MDTQDSLYPIEHYVNISLSENKLIAYLQFNAPDEKMTISMEQLAVLLQSYHIKHGVDYNILTQIVNAPQKFFYSQVEIARGTSPRDGDNGSIHMLYDLNTKNKGPQEQSDGSVDFKEVTRLNNVLKGQKIAERVPATEGVPGRAVTGELLFAKKGKEARFKIGKNVVTDEEQTVMYAAIDGLVTKTERDKVNVFPIYEVNGDVDYHIGNIDFVGTVVIRGNVLSGFRIKASGDIRVTGGVEAADLEADGSIEIHSGILGHNKGIVRAGKLVKCLFIQDGNVEAGEEVIVAQSIMHSQVRAGTNVVCSGSRGLIVGGLVQAGERVEARTIGNTMSTVTVVEVGVLPHLRNELAQLRVELKVSIENMDKTDKALALLDQMALSGQISPEKLEMRAKLNHTRRQMIEDQNMAKERILEIETSLEDTSKSAVVVIGSIYNGAKIVIGRYTRFVKDSAQRVKFQMIDGDIGMLPHK